MSELRAPTPKLDYFEEQKRIRTTAPAIDIHVFDIPDEGKHLVMANFIDGGRRYALTAGNLSVSG